MKPLLSLLPVLLLSSCELFQKKDTAAVDPNDPYATSYPGYDANAQGGTPPPPSPSDYAYNPVNSAAGAATNYYDQQTTAAGNYIAQQGAAVNQYTQPPVYNDPAPSYSASTTPPPSYSPPSYSSPAPSSSGGRSYTVQRGDTLWKIARENNTNVQALKSANGISGDTIIAGQRISIP